MNLFKKLFTKNTDRVTVSGVNTLDLTAKKSYIELLVEEVDLLNAGIMLLDYNDKKGNQKAAFVEIKPKENS